MAILKNKNKIAIGYMLSLMEYHYYPTPDVIYDSGVFALFQEPKFAIYKSRFLHILFLFLSSGKMSSDPLFIEYITELLAPLGHIRTRKMFGEYGIYCNEVFFALVCDGTMYFQVNEEIASEFDELEPPYPGGKPAWKITADILEDRDELLRLARLSYQYKLLK